MKKSYLIIAAAAAIFAACQDTDSIREIKDKGTNNAAITFATGSEKLTRAENSDALYTWTFFVHQSDFKVWGYKILDPTVAVFGEEDGKGTKVTVVEDNGSYKYSYDENGTKPLRFWDKISPSYQFFAAAPAQPTDGLWTFNYTGATADAYGTGLFSTTSSLHGVNLQSVKNGKASGNLRNSFKEATVENGTEKDIDKMIAAPCQVEQSSYNKANPDAVHLNFIHILSKLNVTIKTDLASNLYTVKLLDFKVMNMPGKGNFTEDNNPSQSGNNSRWNQTGYTYSDKINYLTGIDNSTNAVDVTSSKKYIVESLVIPQDINYERVALDGEAKEAINTQDVLFASYAEYTQATPVEELLTEAQFDALKDDPDADKTKITKTPATDIAAYDAVANTNEHSSEPYFVISYSINNDVFTQYYNLVAAFNGLTNNETAFTGDKAGKNVLKFNEGWQNTLNINIHPTEIQFTADIADWSTTESGEFEIEKGNY